LKLTLQNIAQIDPVQARGTMIFHFTDNKYATYCIAASGSSPSLHLHTEECDRRRKGQMEIAGVCCKRRKDATFGGIMMQRSYTDVNASAEERILLLGSIVDPGLRYIGVSPVFERPTRCSNAMARGRNRMIGSQDDLMS
jgi:hypothetical protein